VTRLILLAFLVVGCSTAAHEPTQGQNPDTAGVGSAPETVDTLSGEQSSIESGVASWFNSYGPGLYAAVNSYRFGDPRYSVRVCLQDGSKCVTVVVRDYCQCPGNRIIDLSRDAFSRLADPSVGLVPVTVSPADRTPVAAGRMTLPPTSTR
jgi:rare lipoprotein A (peptidoglycan hydrolase)